MMDQNADIPAAFAAIPTDQWDNIATTLRNNGGVATIDLPDSIVTLHSDCFAMARQGLDVAASIDKCNANIRTIGPNDDSAHATGYHSAGASDGSSLSRYNSHREGFVFSDGNLFDVDLPSQETDTFQTHMSQMFQSMHDGIATNVLKAVARNLGLEGVTGDDWFAKEMGPTDRASQWHVKRYIVPTVEELDVATCTTREQCGKNGNGDQENTDDEVFEWLPVHTDPSLISIVLHDVPGKKGGAMGLQYQAPKAPNDTPSADGQDKKQKVWKEVPHHGHAVATVFVGSVLSYITGGLFPGAKHRVVYNPSGPKQRVAATLFVRPRGDAVLAVPPTPLLTEGERPVKVRNTTFHAWVARVSRNYMKQKKKKDVPATKKENGGAKKVSDKVSNVEPPPMLWRDEYTEITLHDIDPPVTPAQEKYLGGEVSSVNGRIYTVPGHAQRVLEIDPTVEPPAIRQIGPVFKGDFKWLRGIELNGSLYSIPCHADCILKISFDEDGEPLVSTVQWDFDASGAPPKGLQWKWHGGERSPIDGCFYAIPQAANHVMKLDPTDDSVSFIGPAFEGKNLWYGGLVGNDGAIYGVNQNATGVLRIDPVKQTATIHGNYPYGGYKWHGGVKCPRTGMIFGIPAHADSVLKIVPGEKPIISNIGGPLRSGQHRKDNKYKYLGGAVGIDGNIYFFPSDADFVLQVNPSTDKVREVGPNLRDVEPFHHNKWQNGFSSNGGRALYAIPLKANTILRILPKEDGGEPDVTTVGGPYFGLNKWEGGIECQKGDMFCMPLNYNMVLKLKSL